MTKRLREIVEYRDLLRNMIITELKLRYRDSALGFLWTVLNPLFFLLILSIVFSKIMKIQIPNYTIFLLCGLTSWQMLQQTVLIATSSIVANQGIFKKIYVPKIVFPLANVLARYVDHLILTAVLFFFMIGFRMPLRWPLLFVPVLIVLHFLFALGLSLLAAVVYIKVKDIQHILGIVFQALFYITPILYAPENLPPGFRPLFTFNPFYYFVQCFRAPILYGSFPPWKDLLILCALTAVALAAGLALFYRKEKYFIFDMS